MKTFRNGDVDGKDLMKVIEATNRINVPYGGVPAADIYMLALEMEPQITVVVDDSSPRATIALGMAMRTLGAGRVLRIETYAKDKKADGCRSELLHWIREHGLGREICMIRSDTSDVLRLLPEGVDMMCLSACLGNFKSVVKDYAPYLKRNASLWVTEIVPSLTFEALPQLQSLCFTTRDDRKNNFMLFVKRAWEPPLIDPPIQTC